MKRSTAFFLVLIIAMICCIPVQAEDDEFTPTQTNAIDATIEEWLSTPNYRTLFAVSLFLDFIHEKPNLNLSNIMQHSFYLGNGGFCLHLLFRDSTYNYILSYSPFLKKAYCDQLATDGPTSDAALLYAVKLVCGSGNYYEIAPEDLLFE